MALVLSMSVIVTLFGAPIDASLTILIIAASVSCIALGFLGLLQRLGGLDKAVGTIMFYAIVAMYVITSAIAIGIMAHTMPRPVV
jgi:hypothetical protein